MKTINLYTGLSLVLIFLATGYYMEVYFRPAHLENLAMRMEVRANHIYILFIALLNMMSFVCTAHTEKRILRYMDLQARILLIAAGVLSILAFIYEHQGDLLKRYMTLACIVASLTAVTGLVVNEIILRRQSMYSR